MHRLDMGMCWGAIAYTLAFEYTLKRATLEPVEWWHPKKPGSMCPMSNTHNSQDLQKARLSYSDT